MADNHISRFLETLRKSQWASAQELGELQGRLLKRLVLHAYHQTEGYKERLAPVCDGVNVNLSNWHQIPFLTRQDLQERQHLFRAREVPPETGGIVEHTTSGSTGRPMRFVKSPMMVYSSAAIIERGYDWAQADRNATFASIVRDVDNVAPAPHGRVSQGWSWDGGVGRHALLSVAAPVSHQVEFLDRHRPSYLKTYPSNAAALARFPGGVGWSQNLRHIFTFGEVLSEEQIDLIRSNLGVEITDCYASEECGQMATRCSHSGDYHVAVESVLMEVLSDNDRHCRPGETGRIVATPLYNYALPLIRYEQGDLAELPEDRCTCGRMLPELKRIAGRTRNLFVLPNGDRIVPLLWLAVMKYLPAAQWQAVQTALDIIEVRYVHDKSSREADEAGLQDHLRGSLAPNLCLRLIAVEQIERSPSGKFFEFSSLVEQWTSGEVQPAPDLLSSTCVEERSYLSGEVASPLFHQTIMID